MSLNANQRRKIMAINLYQKWENCKESAKRHDCAGSSSGIVFSSFASARFGEIYISVNGTGSESLYIELDDETANSFERPNVSGMVFYVDTFPALDHAKKFLKIALDSQSALPEAFEAFSVTLARTVNTVESSLEAVEAALSIVGKYQAFFGKGKKRRLTAPEEQGLFGELLVLEKCLEAYGDRAIKAWTGPDKNKHDFIFDGNDSIEVKTSLKQTRISVKISNENQLSYAPRSTLFLKILVLEPNPSGQTIVNLIQRIAENLIRDESAKNDFRMKLLELGVEPTLLETGHHYVLVGTHTYRVDEAFPKLTIENIRGISNRIYDLSYRIDLDGVEEERGNIYECVGSK